MHLKRNVVTLSRNHCCRVKGINITYSGCVYVDLVIQHAKCMRYIILSCMGCPAVPYPTTLSHKWHEFFNKKYIELKMYVFILSTTFVGNISSSKHNRARCDLKCVLVLMFSNRFSCHFLMKV